MERILDYYTEVTPGLMEVDFVNKFDLEFYNGYIKTTLRLARKVKRCTSIEEARRIAQEMEDKALKKLEETMGDL